MCRWVRQPWASKWNKDTLPLLCRQIMYMHGLKKICVFSAWIAEWYHTRLWTLACCPGPWVQALVMTNFLSDPSTTSILFSWFFLVYLIQYCYLVVKFVMWIVIQKLKINKIRLKKDLCFVQQSFLFNFFKQASFLLNVEVTLQASKQRAPRLI